MKIISVHKTWIKWTYVTPFLTVQMNVRWMSYERHYVIWTTSINSILVACPLGKIPLIDMNKSAVTYTFVHSYENFLLWFVYITWTANLTVTLARFCILLFVISYNHISKITNLRDYTLHVIKTVYNCLLWKNFTPDFVSIMP